MKINEDDIANAGMGNAIIQLKEDGASFLAPKASPVQPELF